MAALTAATDAAAKCPETTPLAANNPGQYQGQLLHP